MSKVKLTISIDSDLANYLRRSPGVSSTIAEAVGTYRALEVEAKLEEGYREDRCESEQLNDEWESVDVEVEE